MMRPTLAVVVLVTLLAGTAAAQPRLNPGSSEPEPPAVTHYHALTLAADGLSMGLLFAAALADGPDGRDTGASSALVAAGLAGLTLATPIIHAGRGHRKRAGLSLLLRVGMVNVGAMVSMSLARCNSSADPFCGIDSMGYGMLAGYVVASLVDAATMTDEPYPSWSPQLSAHRGGFQVGFATTF